MPRTSLKRSAGQITDPSSALVGVPKNSGPTPTGPTPKRRRIASNDENDSDDGVEIVSITPSPLIQEILQAREGKTFRQLNVPADGNCALWSVVVAVMLMPKQTSTPQDYLDILFPAELAPTDPEQLVIFKSELAKLLNLAAFYDGSAECLQVNAQIKDPINKWLRPAIVHYAAISSNVAARENIDAILHHDTACGSNAFQIIGSTLGINIMVLESADASTEMSTNCYGIYEHNAPTVFLRLTSYSNYPFANHFYPVCPAENCEFVSAKHYGTFKVRNGEFRQEPSPPISLTSASAPPASTGTPAEIGTPLPISTNPRWNPAFFRGGNSTKNSASATTNTSASKVSGEADSDAQLAAMLAFFIMMHALSKTHINGKNVLFIIFGGSSTYQPTMRKIRKGNQVNGEPLFHTSSHNRGFYHLLPLLQQIVDSIKDKLISIITTAGSDYLQKTLRTLEVFTQQVESKFGSNSKIHAFFSRSAQYFRASPKRSMLANDIFTNKVQVLDTTMTSIVSPSLATLTAEIATKKETQLKL